MSRVLVCLEGDITFEPLSCTGTWTQFEYSSLTQFDPVIYDMVWQTILLKFVLGLGIGAVIAIVSKLKHR